MVINKNSSLPHDILKEFDISKYDECHALNKTGWAYQLQWRRWAFDEQLTKDDIADILECPLGDVAESNETIPENEDYRIVEDTSLFGVFSLGETIQKNIKWAHPIMEGYNEDIKYAVRPIPNDLIASFDLEMMKVPPVHGPHLTGHIAVDLMATDEDIVESFKRWLGIRRAEIAHHYEPYERVKTFTQKDFSQWTKKKVLPFIDIQLLEKHFGFSTPYHVIGQLLFPDEVEVDTTERIRKVVKPAAMSLIEDQLLDQLQRSE